MHRSLLYMGPRSKKKVVRRSTVLRGVVAEVDGSSAAAQIPPRPAMNAMNALAQANRMARGVAIFAPLLQYSLKGPKSPMEQTTGPTMAVMPHDNAIMNRVF